MCSVLTQIELRLFKCFELLRLPLAPLTLLTGLNASGKSSVLQSLVLLHQTMSEHEWSTRVALNGSGVRLGTMPDVVDEVFGRDSFAVAVSDEDNTCVWTLGGDRRDMSMGVRTVSVNGRETHAPEQLRYLVPPEEATGVAALTEKLRDLTYITAERMAPQDTYELKDPFTVRTVGPRGEHAVSMLHWARDAATRDELVLPTAPPTLLRQVEARMRTLFPGCTLDLQQTARANGVTLGLRTSDAEEFHRPMHTGFGLTQTLPIVVAVLAARRGDVILIENPEVHLHPGAQSLIGRMLADVARAGVQVVVETHSDHVLNGVRRSVKAAVLSGEQVAIHFFRPRSDDEPSVLAPTMDDSGNIDDWPSGFFDQSDKDSSYFAGWSED